MNLSVLLPVYIYVLTRNQRNSIVFVHGLQNDAWKADNGICWPETLLPAKAPNARILSLKYPVDSVFFNGEGNLLRTSSRLINKLTDLREDEQSVSTLSLF